MDERKTSEDTIERGGGMRQIMQRLRSVGQGREWREESRQEEENREWKELGERTEEKEYWDLGR